MATSIVHDLNVEQGATLHVTFVWQVPDAATLAALVLDPDYDESLWVWEPKDTTPYRARMQVKDKKGSTTAAYVDLSSDPGEGITLGGANGQIAVRMKATETQAIPKDGYYDLEMVLIADAEEVVRLIQGRVILDKEVTTST